MRPFEFFKLSASFLTLLTFRLVSAAPARARGREPARGRGFAAWRVAELFSLSPLLLLELLRRFAARP